MEVSVSRDRLGPQADLGRSGWRDELESVADQVKERLLEDGLVVQDDRPWAGRFDAKIICDLPDRPRRDASEELGKGAFVLGLEGAGRGRSPGRCRPANASATR
jgi:hypothetical protein